MLLHSPARSRILGRFLTDLFESVRFVIDLFKDVLTDALRTPGPGFGSRPGPGGALRIG